MHSNAFHFLKSNSFGHTRFAADGEDISPQHSDKVGGQGVLHQGQEAGEDSVFLFSGAGVCACRARDKLLLPSHPLSAPLHCGLLSAQMMLGDTPACVCVCVRACVCVCVCVCLCVKPPRVLVSAVKY